MIRTFMYRGDISYLFKGRYHGGRIYDNYAHMSLSMANVFESQLMGTQKFKGNLRVDAQIFMPFPDGMGKKRCKDKEGHYYRDSPTLAGMIRAIEVVCANLLFDKDAVIVAMNMEKRWSVEPRLEMVISELGTYGKSSEQQKKQESAEGSDR